MTTENTCLTCRHVRIPNEDEKKQKVQTVCRRYPPHTHFIVVLRQSIASGGPVPVEEQRSAYPNVMHNWTCGEYAPRISLTS